MKVDIHSTTANEQTVGDLDSYSDGLSFSFWANLNISATTTAELFKGKNWKLSIQEGSIVIDAVYDVNYKINGTAFQNRTSCSVSHPVSLGLWHNIGFSWHQLFDIDLYLDGVKMTSTATITKDTKETTDVCTNHTLLSP